MSHFMTQGNIVPRIEERGRYVDECLAQKIADHGSRGAVRHGEHKVLPTAWQIPVRSDGRNVSRQGPLRLVQFGMGFQK